MSHQRSVMIAVVVLSICSLSAQTSGPTFEVASIKKIDQVVTGFFSGPPIRGGTVSMLNSTVASLIRLAYGLRDFQIIGGPDWMRKDLFEIYAKASGEPDRADMLLMLRSLLADRFGLVAHVEQRDMRYLAMVVARDDGRLGPYLHRASDSGPCDQRDSYAVEQTRVKPTAGYSMAGFTCAPLTALAELTSVNAELPIFDRTGLTGRWTATLYFAPSPGVGPQLAGTADPGLSFFPTALQEQFGLKLEPRRGPLDVLVVDSIHQPTEN